MSCAGLRQTSRDSPALHQLSQAECAADQAQPCSKEKEGRGLGNGGSLARKLGNGCTLAALACGKEVRDAACAAIAVRGTQRRGPNHDPTARHRVYAERRGATGHPKPPARLPAIDQQIGGGNLQITVSLRRHRIRCGGRASGDRIGAGAERQKWKYQQAQPRNSARSHDSSDSPHPL